MQNTADMMARGRGRKPPRRTQDGELNNMAKLSDKDVADIRANYALCRVTQAQLGMRYGVSSSTVCMVVNNKSRVRSACVVEA